MRNPVIYTAALLALFSCGPGAPEVQAVPESDPIGFERKDYTAVEDKVGAGEVITSLLTRMGMERTGAGRLADGASGVFDVRRFRAGNRVTAYYSGDSLSRSLEYLVYDNDKVRSTIFKCRDSLCAWTFDKPVTVCRRTLDLTIRTSLWADMTEAGASPLLISELSDIYAWTVNFFALQVGDRFRAVYNEKRTDEEVTGIDGIDFSLYESGQYRAFAIRLDQQDGGNKYWNEKGESMKKAFLKAPLRFSRISSRFSYHRKHPVTGKVKAHTAVDYAAPAGTPVHSIGDGTVTLCGWDGSGGGNRVRIRHMNGYETCYMHLRSFAKGIRAGVKVTQGQTIGYVGSTGRSTGPHLDFRVWKDRRPVDPLKMISPPSSPIRKENLDSLSALLDRYKKELGII